MIVINKRSRSQDELCIPEEGENLFWAKPNGTLKQDAVNRIKKVQEDYDTVQLFLRQMYGLPDRFAEQVEMPECLKPEVVSRAKPKKS